MNRRDFLKTIAAYSAGAGAVALGIHGILGKGSRLEANPLQRAPLNFDQQGPGYRKISAHPDLVAVKGGKPESMFDQGISQLGGIDRFVSPGDRVVIKPNASWNMEPEYAATTNPKLMGRIVEHCKNAGAKKVYVIDHTLDPWRKAYDTSKIEREVKSAGGEIVPANSKGYYQESELPNAEILNSVLVHELILEAEVFINVPILKHHGSTLVTSAMKNLMGVVWDRSSYHWRGLNQCIADFPLLRQPDVNVIDAYAVLMSGGPRGSSYRAEITEKKMQILSTDIVAADTAAVKTWGADPSEVPYIGMAEAHGLGTSNLDSLNIKRLLV